jgi:sphingomyelin phosphodiesterase 2
MRLRIGSFNVWALPWPIARAVSQRIDAIASRLPEFDADVWALQEVWTPRARDTLVAAGRQAGLAHVWHNPGVRMGSGLLVMSRLPLLSAAFTRFALRGYPERIWEGDYHGGKGFVLLRLETRLGPVAFVDTHLHAQYTNDARDGSFPHRVGQGVQLAAALAPIQEPLIAAGDFNMREERPEYRILTGLSGLQDCAARLEQRQETVLVSNPYRGRGHSPGNRIDYVFTRDGRRHGVAPGSIRRIFDSPLSVGEERHAYSDHTGLLAEIDVSPAARDAADAPDAPDAAAAEEARQILDAGRERARAQRTRWRVGTGGLLGGGLALAAVPQFSASRRRMLRTLALLLAPVGVAAAARAEWFGPEEIRAYDSVLRDLAAITARESG